MTPEDIELLKRLKRLLDDGVLTAEEFESQKSALLDPIGEVEIEGHDDESSKTQSEGAEPESNELTTKQRKAALLVLVVGLIIAGCVVLVRGAGNESGKTATKGKSEEATATTTPPISTEAPNVPEPVVPGQVWNWYYLKFACALDKVNSVEASAAGVQEDASSDFYRNEVLPMYSNWAGVSSALAGLIDQQDWPVEVQDAMGEMRQLLLDNSLLLGALARSRPGQKDILDAYVNFDVAGKFNSLDKRINEVIGAPFLTGDGVKDNCSARGYYDEHSPDASLFPLENTGNDIFTGPLVEVACGIARNLGAPNSDNPDWLLNKLSQVANDIVERALSDAQYSLPPSKYEKFGQSLSVSLDSYWEAEQQYSPTSLLLVYDECAKFGW